MNKPKLECPEGHPVSPKWLASMWGRWVQWLSFRKLGKKRFNEIKAENRRSITITKQESGIYQAFVKGQEQIGFGGTPEEAETNLRLKLKNK